jgi:hypothetical protein
LIVAAGDREDSAARKALMDSAPRKSWNIIEHYGIAQAFNLLASWYMMQQMGFISSLYFVMANEKGNKDRRETVAILSHHDMNITLDDFLSVSIKRILTNLLAWLKLCNEYKIDHAALLKDLPFYDVMQYMLLIIDGAAGIAGEEAQPTDSDVEPAYQDMKAVIEKYRKDWE